MTPQQLKNIVQSSHVNFLFGSGLSAPFLSTLGNIEQWLADIVQRKDISQDEEFALHANVLAKYFSDIMVPCMKCELDTDDNYKFVLTQYTTFFQHWNNIISRRHTDLLDKQVNVFTTNIDDLVEKVAERMRLEFNTGFRGHLNPIYDENSFSNIVSKVSPLFHTTASIPIFNYLKMHGSINWKAREDNIITYDTAYEGLNAVQKQFEGLRLKQLLWDFSKIDELLELIRQKIENVKKGQQDYKDCLDAYYSNLVMINPRKEKFKESVLSLHFYELMRLYSNALERNNTVLFVVGFSFADEHIAQITVRAANSNPTLQIIIFAYADEQKQIIENNINKGGQIINNNITLLTPTKYRTSMPEEYQSYVGGLEHFNLESINYSVFALLANIIHNK